MREVLRVTLGFLAGATLAIGLMPLVVRVASGGLSRVQVLDLWPAAAGVFFGGTTLLAVVAGALDGGSGQPSALTRYQVTGMIFLGAYVLASTGFVLIVSRRHRRPLAAVLRETLPSINMRLILVLVVVVWFSRALLGLKYGLHYSGSGTEQRVGALPYGISVIASLSTTISVILPVWAYVTLRSGSRRLVVLMAFLLLSGELLIAFFGGRRTFVFMSALLVLIELTYKRRRGLSTAVVSVLLIGLAWIAVPRFEQARFVASKSIDTSKEDLVEFLEAAKAPRRFGLSGFESNLPERSAIYVEWAAEVARALQDHPFFRGEVLLKGILFSVPTVLVPGKREWEWGEQLINGRLQIGRGDSPNSVAMVGMADFGLSGVLLYAVGFGVFLVTAEILANRIRTSAPLLSLIILLSALEAAVMVEQTIVTLSAQVRNIVLIAIVVGIVHLMKVRGDSKWTAELSHFKI